MFAGGCHTYVSVLGDILLVPVILFLTLLSRFPLNGGSVRHRASIAATVTSWQHPVETRHRSCRLVHWGRDLQTRSYYDYGTIKIQQNGMRWLGTLQKTCTAINITSPAHCENAPTTAV